MSWSFWKVYLQLGWEHILDINGYDHILFVTALCATFTFLEWKKVIWLVTAFTVGHSLTLALAALDLVQVNPDIIETLIPITIVITGLYQLWTVGRSDSSKAQNVVRYAMAIIFGLIHGLGFSNYFKAIIGQEESLVQALLAFNLGVESGQIAFVLIILTFTTLLSKIPGLTPNFRKILLSAICTVWAFYLIFA